MSMTATPEATDQLSILMVEDNPDDQFLVRDMLADPEAGEFWSHPPQIHATTRLSEGLELLGRARLDVVLLDLTLPDTEGLETFHRLRAHDPQIPVIILSGMEDQELALQAVKDGAQDYLVKGDVDAATLARALHYAVERSRHTENLLHSHERFRRLLDTSAEPTLVATRAGQVRFVNAKAAERLGGIEPEAWVGRDLDLAALQDGSPLVAPETNTQADATVTDTVWEGELAFLVALEAADDPSQTSPQGTPAAALAPSAAQPAQPLASPGRISRFEGIRTASPAMRQLFETCIRVAPTSASVLILGETGTGKELLARAIHRRSGRSGRFVAVNCGAVPENLIESELFGHEKGAFTGANQRKPGLFRYAEGGTLFLDEIGSLSLPAQNSLLRTLQEGTVRPVGSTREEEVDVRVVAATSVSLFEAVRKREFREDLLYRLDVIRIEVLPLRERPEDILHLFKFFCRELAARHEVEIPRVGSAFLEAMVAYPWPGNVRQLENFTERFLLTGVGDFLTGRDFHELARPYTPAMVEHGVDVTAHPGTYPGAPPHLPAAPAQHVNEASASAPVSAPPNALAAIDLSLSLAEFCERQERAYLEAVLADRQGRIQAASDIAGINRRTLLRKLKRYGIDKADFK